MSVLGVEIPTSRWFKVQWHSSGGPTPMEVDQVGQIKRKQKGKYKGKDKKGGGWFPFGHGGKQGGKNFKGKGKKGKRKERR